MFFAPVDCSGNLKKPSQEIRKDVKINMLKALIVSICEVFYA